MAIGSNERTRIPVGPVRDVRFRARAAPTPIEEGAVYGAAIALGALVGAFLGLLSTGVFG